MVTVISAEWLWLFLVSVCAYIHQYTQFCTMSLSIDPFFQWYVKSWAEYARFNTDSISVRVTHHNEWIKLGLIQSCSAEILQQAVSAGDCQGFAGTLPVCVHRGPKKNSLEPIILNLN